MGYRKVPTTLFYAHLEGAVILHFLKVLIHFQVSPPVLSKLEETLESILKTEKLALPVQMKLIKQIKIITTDK